MSAINSKYMIYATYVDNILYNFHIPCYKYTCPTCKVTWDNETCSICSGECLKEPYVYAFFNNQVYQKRINNATNEVYYVTVVNHFLRTLSSTNWGDNTISYKRYVKQLYKKCTFYFENERVIVVKEPKPAPKPIVPNVMVKPIVPIVGKNPKPIVGKNPKPIVPKPAPKVLPTSKAPAFNKSKTDLAKILMPYDITNSYYCAERFFKDHEDEYPKDIQDSFKYVCDISVYKRIEAFDYMINNWGLFKVSTELYNDIIESVNDDDVKHFVEFCFMAVNNYVKACCNLPKVREIIKKNKDSNYFTKEEVDQIMTKLANEDAVRIFAKYAKSEIKSTMKIVDKLKYIKLFSYEILKEVDE